MANFKAKRPRKQRAGCGMCKPNKKSGNAGKLVLGHRGFGKLRSEAAAKEDSK